jgi:hypothetical protein
MPSTEFLFRGLPNGLPAADGPRKRHQFLLGAIPIILGRSIVSAARFPVEIRQPLDFIAADMPLVA